VQLQDTGKIAEAIPLFTQAITLGYQPINQAHFRLARAYARAGQVELALMELEGLAAAGFATVPALPATDFDTLRALPRFKAFESRVNANAHPCAADPKFHAFDFWIGE
jgi:thioredoxin-like negative regulator of GroEL